MYLLDPPLEVVLPAVVVGAQDAHDVRGEVVVVPWHSAEDVAMESQNLHLAPEERSDSWVFIEWYPS